MSRTRKLIWSIVLSISLSLHNTRAMSETVDKLQDRVQAVAQQKWGGRRIDNPLYDLSIRKWNGIYNPSIPWYWAKAQLLAESGLNPVAVSPVGAMGLGQFMPNTWKDMEQQLKIRGSAYNPYLNIQASAYYMSKLRAQFKKDRPEWDRHSLALASYNAGLGNVLKAQKAGGGSLYYKPMIEALPSITGKKHSKETTDYVNRIWGYVDHYRRKEEEL